MSLMNYIFNILKAIFGIKEETPAQPTPTVSRPVYKNLIVTNEGVPTTGEVKSVSLEKIEFITTLEKLDVKSEILQLIRNKEAERINEYEFETETGRYKVYGGQVQRYPKTN